MIYPLVSLQISSEEDVVLTRQRAREISSLVHLNNSEQTAFATAVSELARNAFQYAGNGRASFSLRVVGSPQAIIFEVQDKGAGIRNVQDILEGRYKSETGLGLGLICAKRLNDDFKISTMPGQGTTVRVEKYLTMRATEITADFLQQLTLDLSRRTPKNRMQEVQEQNRELLQAMQDLQSRQAEVERLNLELAETNRGVVALYAELDEKADSLRKASEYKSRFLSDMTHELRTPLNAIVSLSRLLIDRTDGELTEPQEKQVRLIHRSATSLGEMVNDLLDLAKIEAGKTDMNLSDVSIPELFMALRGMFRPLAADGPVALVIEEPNCRPTIYCDERKLSQILRNLVSNALKFTEQGEVRVTANERPPGTMVFEVADTGIGIAAENLGLIFNDFTQIDSGIQRRVRGTGLGLPLTKKLAKLLGGDVTVVSKTGFGSLFAVCLPVCYSEPAKRQSLSGQGQ